MVVAPATTDLQPLQMLFGLLVLLLDSLQQLAKPNQRYWNEPGGCRQKAGTMNLLQLAYVHLPVRVKGYIRSLKIKVQLDATESKH